MEYAPQQQVVQRLTEMTTEFAGWRIGKGGSGHWWAIRGNELLRSLSADELRDWLHDRRGASVALGDSGQIMESPEMTP